MQAKDCEHRQKVQALQQDKERQRQVFNQEIKEREIAWRREREQLWVQQQDERRRNHHIRTSIIQVSTQDYAIRCGMIF